MIGFAQMPSLLSQRGAIPRACAAPHHSHCPLAAPLAFVAVSVSPHYHCSPSACKGAGLFGGSKHDKQCLIEFNQSVQPKSVPRPLRGLARRIAASSLKTTMDDADKEARRIRAGKPTLPGFEMYADNASTGNKAAPAVASVALSMARPHSAASPEKKLRRATPAERARKRAHQQDLPEAASSTGTCGGIDRAFGVWDVATWQPLHALRMIVHV